MGRSVGIIPKCGRVAEKERTPDVLDNVLPPAGEIDIATSPTMPEIPAEAASSIRLGDDIRLLKDSGRWVNFGSLAFAHPDRARRYSPEEAKAIVGEAGFSDPYVSQVTIPYMCSPASRHGRQERVFTFSAYKERNAEKPARHKALPDWLVTGDDPVPLSPSFRQQAMSTQIYSFIMSLIDGKRSIKDMAAVLEKQRLMSKEEAVPAIRTFLTKMFDDAQRQSHF